MSAGRLQPLLRWSRRARPAVVERVPRPAGWAGAGPGHRSSSLSRCPPGRLPALVAVVSTGSTGGGRAGAYRPGDSGLGSGRRSSSPSRCPQGRLPALVAGVSTGSTGGGRAGARGRVSRGWGRATAHRACRDVRRVGSQPSLRWSRRARPAVVERVPTGRVTRGWGRATAHRACRDVRRVGSQPSLRGSRRLDRRWSSGCLPTLVAGVSTVALAQGASSWATSRFGATWR